MPKTRENWMPEPEVAILLAAHLLDTLPGATHADVAIDNATVEIRSATGTGDYNQKTVIFPLKTFLEQQQWDLIRRDGKRDWQGEYRRGVHTLTIQHRHGADVTVTTAAGRVLAECKAGPLEPVKGRGEHSILCTAIGQAVTMKSVTENDKLVVAVPMTERFECVVGEILALPLVQRTGIRIMLVGRGGEVKEL